MGTVRALGALAFILTVIAGSGCQVQITNAELLERTESDVKLGVAFKKNKVGTPGDGTVCPVFVRAEQLNGKGAEFCRTANGKLQADAFCAEPGVKLLFTPPRNGPGSDQELSITAKEGFPDPFGGTCERQEDASGTYLGTRCTVVDLRQEAQAKRAQQTARELVLFYNVSNDDCVLDPRIIVNRS